MKKQFLVILLILPFLFALTVVSDHWISKKHTNYTIFYQRQDAGNIKDYNAFFENGQTSAIDFFQNPFKEDFNIYVHPNRSSLDSAWQKDWNMPGFKSQCWMVASGISDKMDIISPKQWDAIACEHKYADSLETQRLITHEMVHVFHGQHNKSPDFSDVSGIDWFVEGLATYASGQCDETRIAEVKAAVKDNTIPNKLTEFWTGNLKYGLSGTVVMYLDKTYGRTKLIGLLKYNTLEELLEALQTTESEIVNGWRNFLNTL